MKNILVVRTAWAVGLCALMAGTVAAQQQGGTAPPPPNPALLHWSVFDQSISQAIIHCGDPIHCPPIHAAIVAPWQEVEQVAVPPHQDLADPSARVVAGFAGGLFALSGVLQADRDPNGVWALATGDLSPLPAGERLGYVGSTYFGEVVVLAQSSPYARLADKEIDGRAQAVVMALAQGAPSGRTGALGVWYDGQVWWAYDEAGAKLAAGERVVFLDAADKGGRATHSAENDFGGIGLVLDDPRLNDNPDAVLIAQHAFRKYLNTAPLAASYEPGQGRWIVYNADGSPLALNEAIHYIVGP
jgi:hypothetical protein